ncbi:MAG: hypothetical protein ACOY5Y_09495 [Pseudomonadota bacterium]|jgi:hypothetical protein
MKISATATALAAVLALGGAAVASDADAQSRRSDRASTHGWGAAEAGPQGAYADADVGAKSRRDRADRNRRAGRDRGEAVSSATTFGGGSIYTDRRRAAAAASTGGAATGPGSQNTSSEVDVYGFTDRQGSEAGAYGGSTAESREPRRRRD